jgi:hypothetical protein
MFFFVSFRLDQDESNRNSGTIQNGQCLTAGILPSTPSKVSKTITGIVFGIAFRNNLFLAASASADDSSSVHETFVLRYGGTSFAQRCSS